MEVSEVVAALGGAAPTRMLRERGITERQLRRAVELGLVRRHRAGLMMLPDARPDVLRARAANARITCASAADFHGLWNLRPPSALHLQCTRGLCGTGIVPHRGGIVPPHPELPYAGLADVLLHALHCLPRLEALVMVEHAVQRGETTVAFLTSHLPGPRNGRARAVLALVQPGADSLLETVARVLFRDAGLQVQTQVFLDGVGYVDFLIEGFLVVEIDGAAFHMSRKAFRRDLLRNNRVTTEGLPVLRFMYEDVVHHPEDMLRQVFRVIGRAR